MFDAINEATIPPPVDAFYARARAHPRLGPVFEAAIAADLFPLWLDLFEATARDLFAPQLAARFNAKARMIGESLKLALFFRPERPWPDDLRRPAG